MSIIDEIERFELVNQLYTNNLRSSEVIIKELNLTNKSIDSTSEQNSKFGYGELTKDGVKQLYQFLTSKISDEINVTFCDVGSGNGKICIHLSLLSNFKKIIGVELNDVRIEYSNYILSQMKSVKNVEFYREDATDFDFNNIDIVFINDLLFEREDVDKIVGKLKSGTHLITIEKNKLTPLEKIYFQVDWMPVPIPFNYYII